MWPQRLCLFERLPGDAMLPILDCTLSSKAVWSVRSLERPLHSPRNSSEITPVNRYELVHLRVLAEDAAK